LPSFNYYYFIVLKKKLRLKRTNSGALEGDPSTPLSTEDFRRGGTLRATAGPRLGWKNGSPGPAETIKPIQE
jgi:hypothetical protein